MRLYELPVSSVEWQGREYRLTPWFDRVLRVYDVQADAGFTDAERLDISLALLVRGKYPADPRLLKAIFDALITVKPRGESTVRAVDFLQDAPYIYAAYRQAYGINLFEQHGRLHWQEFISLFASLPTDTRIMEIAGIRTRDLPKPTKNNAEERAAIMKQKCIYALELSAEEREQNVQRGLLKMVTALTAMSGGENIG